MVKEGKDVLAEDKPGKAVAALPLAERIQDVKSPPPPRNRLVDSNNRLTNFSFGNRD